MFDLIAGVLLNSLQSKPIVYTQEKASQAIELVIPTVEAATKEVEPVIDLKEKAYIKALNAGVSWKKLNNLITFESSWNPNADNEEDRGLVQISRTYHKEVTDEQAFNEDFALDWVIDVLKRGDESMYTVCNCFSWVKVKLHRPDLLTKDVIVNSMAVPGSIAIVYYKDSKGKTVIHYSYVMQVMPGAIYTSNANLSDGCGITENVYDLHDPRIHGYYLPLSDT